MAETRARGRDAAMPQKIPARGWRDIFMRTKDSIAQDHVSVMAAGVAFFGLLALFPAIASLVAIAGLVTEPAAIEGQIQSLAAALPPNAAEIIEGQARKVAEGSGAGLGLGAALGLALSLYSASSGMKTLIEGMNVAYGEQESRGFIALNLTALALTLFLILALLLAIGATVIVPALLGAVGLGEPARIAVAYGRWPILAVLTVLGLAVIYRYGPSRATPRWRWVSVGALLATLIWIAGSIAFSLYVRNFADYNETYGALGGVIVLLTWLWLSAFVVLFGAEVNAEAEHQTRRDTTSGDARSEGERGAVKADTWGRAP